MPAQLLKKSSQVLHLISSDSDFSALKMPDSHADWSLNAGTIEDIPIILDEGETLIVDVASIEQIPNHGDLSKIIYMLKSNDPLHLIEILHRYPYIHHIFSNTCSLPLTQIENVITQAAGEKLPSNQELKKVTISNYNQKNEILQEIADHINQAKVFRDLADRARTATSELIMNAIFNAPIDPQTGKAKYAALSRSQSFSLAEREYIELEYGFDEGVFSVGVKDHFGSLTRDKIVNNLYRCAQAGTDQIRQSSGGAGVGLYLLINLCSQLDIYIRPGESTEVVAKIIASKRQKDYESQEKMFNIYVTPRSPI